MDVNTKICTGLNDFNIVTSHGHIEPRGKEESVVWILVLYQLTWRSRELASWFIISSASISRESILVRRTTPSAKSRSVKGSVHIVLPKKARWCIQLSSQSTGVRKRSRATMQPWCTPLPIRNWSKSHPSARIQLTASVERALERSSSFGSKLRDRSSSQRASRLTLSNAAFRST